jgi:hypothetical protein
MIPLDEIGQNPISPRPMNAQHLAFLWRALQKELE